MASKQANGGAVDENRTAKDIAKGFADAGNGLAEVEEGVVALRRKLAQQAEAVAASEEERRRAHEKEMYDLQQERQRIKDQHAREDAERAEAFMRRKDELIEVTEEFCALVGLPIDGDELPGVKKIREALEAKLEAATKAAEQRGRGIAKTDYDTLKKIDEANAAKDKALLEQENKTIKERNAALEKQNTDLLAAQQKVMGDMKDVAKGAFDAAGGVQGRANQALADAAQGGRSDGRR